MKTLSQRLHGLRCSSCGQLFVADQFRCSRCDGSEFKKCILKGKAQIYSFTVIRVPPQQFVREAPYVVAIVKLDDGPHLTVRIDDGSDSQRLRIGAKVRFERKEGARYWFKVQTPS